MLRRACFLASKQNCPLYLVHLSTEDAVQGLREMLAHGIDVTGESVIHHLVFNREVYDGPLGTTFRYVPPMREESDRLAVWEAIADGTISCIGSDHISVRRSEKYPLPHSIWDAHGGNPGSGMILPVMLSEGVNKGRVSLPQLTQLCSLNPAKVFGLTPEKGTISIGADADLVLVDLDKEVTMRPQDMHLEFSLYEGMTFRGWPVMTMLRGNVVMENGDLAIDKGAGKYLPRVVF
jgi:dihydroorotase-like cyclic amidohydrolase